MNAHALVTTSLELVYLSTVDLGIKDSGYGRILLKRRLVLGFVPCL